MRKLYKRRKRKQEKIKKNHDERRGMWIRKEIARKRRQERKKNRCKITTEERNREINHKILIKEKKKKRKGRKGENPSH